ncbi:MAG: hypothetical protein WC451_05945 [Patescibacteria group bacterium]
MAAEVPHRVDDLLQETIGDGSLAAYGGEEGVLIIATPPAAAKLKNDATILDLMRRMRANDQTLCGQYLIVAWPGSSQGGIITTVTVDRVAYDPARLTFGIHGHLNINNLAELSVQVVLASSRLEAERMLAEHLATLGTKDIHTE